MTHFPWSCLYVYVLLIDLSWVFSFFLWELPPPRHFPFQIKEVNIENVSKPICFWNTPLRNSGWCCVWYAQRHLSLIYLLGEGDRGWSAPGIRAASMRYDAAWFWSLTFAFSCILKKQGLPSIKELFKWPSTVHVFLQFCCGNMRTHTDISITYARLRVGPVDAITVCAILSHSESQRLPDRHT